MHHVISIPAAAELCGVGEPAIRRAFREGRIDLGFAWHVGRGQAGIYLNLSSVIACYGVVKATVEANVERFAKNATIVTTPDGERWIILDLLPSVMFPEGPEGGDDA